ncbi:glutaredoxin 3 [Pseudoalteromonas phenolica]|uniref:Glutaredoxin n=1 Tax=Pseudoalteromonas phenolica TaxID=161398 RepID=A0A0S2K754_9GAMM|nr:glutaredoxin 3 [Pseudoalteromonas phenolica]ALO44150.1 Glutaredoxin 3 [Pseudoalteromonas phenolica]MBE0357138.1 glutaredoxin 3 [Pseudoalteromonas phenolica O-BC30]
MNGLYLNLLAQIKQTGSNTNPMANITLFHKDYCPYCKAAKALLAKLEWQYKEIEVSDDQDAFNNMVELSGGRRTVPQIFINDQHIGGFDDFQAYVKKLGKLKRA